MKPCGASFSRNAVTLARAKLEVQLPAAFVWDLSRLVLGVHWPSDVLAALCLGVFGLFTFVSSVLSFSTSPSLLVGRPVESILPGVGELRRGDLTVPTPDDDKTLNITVSPLRDVKDQVIGRVVNFQDLTEFYDELKDLDARKAEMEVRRYQLPLPSLEDSLP